MMSQDIQKLLALDYVMIIEAIRRLLEGTDCSVDDDKISATDLYNRVKQAFSDHVYYEDKALTLIMARINDSEVKNLCLKMKDEHLYMRGLLETIGHELADTHPAAYRAVLTALRRALQSHSEIEKLLPLDQWLSQLSEESLTKIANREEETISKLQ